MCPQAIPIENTGCPYLSGGWNSRGEKDWILRQVTQDLRDLLVGLRTFLPLPAASNTEFINWVTVFWNRFLISTRALFIFNIFSSTILILRTGWRKAKGLGVVVTCPQGAVCLFSRTDFALKVKGLFLLPRIHLCPSWPSLSWVRASPDSDSPIVEGLSDFTV